MQQVDAPGLFTRMNACCTSALIRESCATFRHNDVELLYNILTLHCGHIQDQEQCLWSSQGCEVCLIQWWSSSCCQTASHLMFLHYTMLKRMMPNPKISQTHKKASCNADKYEVKNNAKAPEKGVKMLHLRMAWKWWKLWVIASESSRVYTLYCRYIWGQEQCQGSSEGCQNVALKIWLESGGNCG